MHGKEIKRFREKLGIKQAEFAQMVGYTQSQISNIEREKYEVTVNLLQAIANTFNTEIMLILEPQKE